MYPSVCYRRWLQDQGWLSLYRISRTNPLFECHAAMCAMTNTDDTTQTAVANGAGCSTSDTNTASPASAAPWSRTPFRSPNLPARNRKSLFCSQAMSPHDTVTLASRRKESAQSPEKNGRNTGGTTQPERKNIVGARATGVASFFLVQA